MAKVDNTGNVGQKPKFYTKVKNLSCPNWYAPNWYVLRFCQMFAKIRLNTLLTQILPNWYVFLVSIKAWVLYRNQNFRQDSKVLFLRLDYCRPRLMDSYICFPLVRKKIVAEIPCPEYIPRDAGISKLPSFDFLNNRDFVKKKVFYNIS